MKALKAFEDLFPRDSFSESLPATEVLPASAVSPVASLLQTHYPFLKTIKDVRSPQSFQINSRIFLVRAETGPYVFKKVPLTGILSQSTLESLLQFVNETRKAGLRFPEIYKTKQGSLSFAQDGFLYYLMEHADAAQYAAADESTLWNVAAETGRMFHYFRGRTIDLPERKFFTSEDHATFESLKAQPPKHEYWETFAEYYLKVKERYLEIGWDHFKLSPGHIDLHPHNILVSKTREVYFVDLESIQQANPFICMGYSMFKIMRNYAALQKSKITKVQLADCCRRYVDCLIKSDALRPGEVSWLKLGTEIENAQRFLNVLKNRKSMQEWGHCLPMFGGALAGEIDFVFPEEIFS